MDDGRQVRVRNVLRKLKCANKHQAMLKAFSLGLL